jgi:hypothetical protein
MRLRFRILLNNSDVTDGNEATCYAFFIDPAKTSTVRDLADLLRERLKIEDEFCFRIKNATVADWTDPLGIFDHDDLIDVCR